ncbi:MAG: DUF1206 domain-containing protein [Ktedonobacterales bacterium]
MANMANSPAEAARHFQQAQHTARRTATSPWARALARAGYAAKGIIYLLIGILAIQAAVGAGGAITDQHGALAAIYAQPFGRVLLALITIGLLAYGLWSFCQAFLDVEGKGTDAKGIVTRIGYGVVGIIYIGLGVGAARFDAGLGSAGKSSNTSTQDWTARLLKAPGGTALVVIVGLVVLGVAAAMFYRAYKADFSQQLGGGGTMRDAVIWLGRLGYAALGFVFVIVGLFLIVAAVHHNPSQAQGLSGALDTLARQPFGPALLAVVALGLIAYGLYSLAEARYRRIGSAG